VEPAILPTCRDLGIGFVAYAPLGRGFLTGTIPTQDALIADDRRRDHPRFSAENLAANARLLAALEPVARAHGATLAQVAIAWVLAQGRDVVAIPGAKRRKWLDENAAAASLALTAAEIAALDAAFAPGAAAGTRYPVKQMAGVGI
jgi:aryl-alcohol dehydrogenase-like predicted oxidoreductase